MSIPIFRRLQARQVKAPVRVAAQRTSVTLTVVRSRAQPTAATIVRLAGTALFAYLLALLLPHTSRPVLAPLTALLVVQASLYQTVRSAITKVGSVVAGVLLAVALSAWVGFTWWSLGIAIAVALAIGYALHLGDNILEVPISAMLILSVGTRAAATSRIVETLVGAAAGLVAGLVLSPPRLQLAEEAIQDLCARMADLLNQIAAGLREDSVPGSVGDWLNKARSLGGEIRRVDDALSRAEESLRLNPRSMLRPVAPTRLRDSLETLEHEATIIRVLTRSLADATQLGGDSPLNDPDVRDRMAGVLSELSAAVLIYGRLATEDGVSGLEPPEAELERHLDRARDLQERLRERLETRPAASPAGWPLRGELMSHLDRFRNELRWGRPELEGRLRRRHSWRPPLPRGRLRPPRRRHLPGPEFVPAGRGVSSRAPDAGPEPRHQPSLDPVDQRGPVVRLGLRLAGRRAQVLVLPHRLSGREAAEDRQH